MRRKLSVLPSLLLCLMPAVLLLSPHAARPSAAAAWNAKACYDKAQTQLDLTTCASTEYKQTDTELNRLYKLLMPKLSKPRQQQLITAQTAWIKFRDSNCQFVSSAYEGGSIQPMIKLQCLNSLTLERNQHFVGLLDEIKRLSE